ncbi:hypothetical protein BD779DRAFT_1554735 [Infundibulicybe gibba]|nr:hypothetical protein BD779DRAFT_1554735 [Infundibulicybe gibba]
MPMTSIQKTAIEEVISAVVSLTGPRGKRQLSAMFMDLVDETEWPQYYELIPEPRCINKIRTGVEKGRYKEPMDVYTDLSLVFWNALFYNEPESQISADAATLKTLLETEWKKKSVLPIPRVSPPSSSPQVVHAKSTENPPTSSARALEPPQPIQASTVSQSSPDLSPPIANNGPALQPTPEIEVDIGGMSPEPDVSPNGGNGVATDRDTESEEIIKHLEGTLPRWPGFGDEGWMDEVSLDRCVEILHIIKSHKDIIGNRLATALEAVPENSSIPYLSYSSPLSFKTIENYTRNKSYPDTKAFDRDMARLFEKARRWHKSSSDAYGKVLHLQRLYQALTSPYPPVGPPYHSSNHFASIAAGPGMTGSSEPMDVSLLNKTPLDEVAYKGWKLRVGDWVHLSNPDDPSRPIVAQVFGCWRSTESSREQQEGLTVCWYFRPEQTFHAITKVFWDGEILKSATVVNQGIEDLIEKVACQFISQHVEGRPRAPFWYPGFPLYVCEAYYNERERLSAKIKVWSTCMPEKIARSAELMPIYPFERTVYPRRLSSPFTKRTGKGGKGPGGIIENAMPITEDGDRETGRKRTRRSEDSANKPIVTGINMATTYSYQPSNPSQPVQLSQRLGPDRSILSAIGGAGSLGSSAQIEKLPLDTSKHFDRDPETNEVLWFGAPPADFARVPKPRHSLAYLHFLATKQQPQGPLSADRMDVDADHAATSEPRSRKRPHIQALPTVTETLKAVFHPTRLPAERSPVAGASALP